MQHLVNDVTIAPCESVDPICYFHIELDRHGVIIAEGAPAETFVDCDSRAMFQNAAGFPMLYPAGLSPAWQRCAPLIEHGPILAGLRAELAARAAALGHVLPVEAEIALAPGLVRATLASNTELVRLRSPAAYEGADRRCLGALLTALRLDGVPVDLADPALASGFHEPERHDGRIVRWTNGEAIIRLGRAEGSRTISRIIEVEVYRIPANTPSSRAA